MKCPKCQSEHCHAQIVTQTKLKTKHNWVYWLIIGWWLEPCLWLFLTIPKLLVAIFSHKKQKVVQKNINMFICDDCGYSWKA
jgi:hypothetical protein